MVDASTGPTQLGRYALITKLASGGMGSVHLGRSRGELGFARLVAVKQVHPHLLEQPESIARFLREARVASHVRHPHVVAVLDVGQEKNVPYLVLDYVRGASLSTLITRARTEDCPPSIAVACAIAREALEGLHAVHTATDETGTPLGVIHRDVSPQNILVSGDGVTYVTDFGVAFAKDAALTQGSGVLGKAGYLAPEQLAREPLTPAVDVFAMGIVMWELFTLRRLFDGLETQVAMLAPGHTVERPSVYRKDLPRELDDLIMRMLARDAGARPASAAEVAKELQRLAAPAPRSEISDWVLSLVDADLERLDAVVKAAAAAGNLTRSETPPPMSNLPSGSSGGGSGRTAGEARGGAGQRSLIYGAFGAIVGAVVIGGATYALIRSSGWTAGAPAPGNVAAPSATATTVATAVSATRADETAAPAPTLSADAASAAADAADAASRTNVATNKASPPDAAKGRRPGPGPVKSAPHVAPPTSAGPRVAPDEERL